MSLLKDDFLSLAFKATQKASVLPTACNFDINLNDIFGRVYLPPSIACYCDKIDKYILPVITFRGLMVKEVC